MSEEYINLVVVIHRTVYNIKINKNDIIFELKLKLMYLESNMSLYNKCFLIPVEFIEFEYFKNYDKCILATKTENNSYDIMMHHMFEKYCDLIEYIKHDNGEKHEI